MGIRRYVDVVEQPPGWVVSVTDERGAQVGASRRIGITTGENTFPRPPDGSTFDTEPQEVKALVTAPESAPIKLMLLRLTSRTPRAPNESKGRVGDVLALGRYLFECLFGESLWAAIIAGVECPRDIELVLRFPKASHAFKGLPWELMASRAGPISAKYPDCPTVSLCREVKTDVASNGRSDVVVDAPPRVLFVVGADLADPAVRPGAEYLSILRRLRRNAIALNTRVLLEASRDQLQAALESAKPAVLHIVCHGDVDPVTGRGFLGLTTKTARAVTVDRLFAGGLLALFNTSHRPNIVVLSACRTAGEPSGRAHAISLAEELVAGGIPIVVAMGGRVADSACRLFSRCFYNALLAGQSAIAAAAEGRRAGLAHLDWQTTSDWALPTLFVSSACTGKLRVRGADAAAKLEELVAEFRGGTREDPFCDRLNIVTQFSDFLDPAGSLSAGALALGVTNRESAGGARYGKTWALRALARETARSHHLPILLRFTAADPTPTRLIDLSVAIVGLCRATLERLFGHAPTDFQVLRLRDAIRTGQTPAVHPDIQVVLGFAERADDPAVQLAAIRKDLHDLFEVAKSGIPLLAAGGPAVLIDDLHRCGKVGVEFLRKMLGSHGLGTSLSPIPVVFTYNRYPPNDSHLNNYAEEIHNFTDPHSNVPVFGIELGGFGDEREARPVYQERMLYGFPSTSRPVPPAVPSSAADHAHQVDVLFRHVADEVDGIPSNFGGEQGRRVQGLVQVFLDLGALLEADDEALLKGLEGGP